MHPPKHILSTGPVLDSKGVGGTDIKTYAGNRRLYIKKKITLYCSIANTNQWFGSAVKKEKQTKITQVTKGK